VSARRRLPGLLLGGVTALAAGCGLSTDDEPVSITAATEGTSTTTTSTPSSTPGLPDRDTDNVTVFFLQTVGDAEEILFPVPRPVPLPATPATRLDALLTQPPTPEEREEGLWSAIPADATLAERPQQQGHELIVDLPEGVYDQLHGIIAQNAFAQIVYTATAIPGVESVTFQRDGTPFEAVDGTGQAQSEPLTRADFPDLAPVED
jgi:spore germination protein GerM